jgi:hypothetical protein
MNPNNHQARFFSDNGRPIRVLRFVHEYTLQHKQSPTIREVGAGCDISSTSVVNYYIDELMKFGCLEEPERSLDGYAKSRFLRLTETGLNNIGLKTVKCQARGSDHIVGKVHRYIATNTENKSCQ